MVGTRASSLLPRLQTTWMWLLPPAVPAAGRCHIWRQFNHLALRVSASLCLRHCVSCSARPRHCGIRGPSCVLPHDHESTVFGQSASSDNMAETPGQGTKGVFFNPSAHKTSPCLKDKHAGERQPASPATTCSNHTEDARRNMRHQPCPITLSHTLIHAPTPPHKMISHCANCV